MTTYYMTRYCLSSGIEAIETDRQPGDDGYLYLHDRFMSFKLGHDLFRTVDEAVADAEKRRTKKIAALRKQIGKLESITFNPTK